MQTIWKRTLFPLCKKLAVVSEVYSACAANFGFLTSNTNSHDSINLDRQFDRTGSRCLVHHIVLTFVLVIIFCDAFLMSAFTTAALKVWPIWKEKFSQPPIKIMAQILWGRKWKINYCVCCVVRACHGHTEHQLRIQNLSLWRGWGAGPEAIYDLC